MKNLYFFFFTKKLTRKNSICNFFHIFFDFFSVEKKNIILIFFLSCLRQKLYLEVTKNYDMVMFKKVFYLFIFCHVFFTYKKIPKNYILIFFPRKKKILVAALEPSRLQEEKQPRARKKTESTTKQSHQKQFSSIKQNFF